MNTYSVWFGRVVILGILVNLFFALPGIFAPVAVVNWVGIGPIYQPLWPAFASLLLLLLSLFYIPGAIDPFRYRPIACLSVISRFAGVIFFFVLWRMYPLFGAIDLVFGLVQAILLWLALRRGPNDDY